MSGLPTHGVRDLIVVGAGGAGLYTALCAARDGARVTLISSRPLAEANSYWAQGGLAAAVADEDSPAAHLADTVAAGRDAVKLSAARVLTEGAPEIVADLTRLGVTFDADREGRLALGLEGGHRIRRVVHAGGAATGRRIVRQLSALAAEHPLIDVLEGTPVTAILTHDGRASGVELRGGERRLGTATVLATGGAAALWARTTNPRPAVGNGMLLAFRAGAALADIELMQFHPTAVVGTNGTSQADGFLVTEAIRGEGAILCNRAGERFVDELAPRDEVARAIHDELLRSRATSVALDMRGVDPGLFPNVVSHLRSVGIDPERELIPVAPAAHYMMGGIATDLTAASSVAGLYAVGECACTGLHGANRLASNSLTECFVFGRQAAHAALAEPALAAAAAAASVSTSTGPPPPLTQASREALWRDAGLQRTGEGLARLREDAHPLVRLIATAAITRTESRGAHKRDDFPERDPAWDHEHVVLTPGSAPAREHWA
ncbi:L-aspartate oxidase [Conexibacter sp. DBS9H8]|uniref:L-aspartate oxidase n=1 Tax=Conexibacter sp. DBS9H8 TaxID=2937801 RepID=UPI00200FCBFD|nr:FAD-dependent oxidoreductase [Conexibacter sp. DBS9H8]